MQCVQEIQNATLLIVPGLSQQEARLANNRCSIVLLSGYISAVNSAVGKLLSAGLLDCETLLKIDEYLFLKRRQLEQITRETIKDVYC